MEKSYNHDINLGGNNSIKDAQDIEIRELNMGLDAWFTSLTGAAPKQQSVKEHLRKIIEIVYAGTNQDFNIIGGRDASGNPNFPAASKGDYYYFSAEGYIGGGSGIRVSAYDSMVCIADTLAGTWAAVGANWKIFAFPVDATEILRGMLEIASTGEAQATTSDDKIMTPHKTNDHNRHLWYMPFAVEDAYTTDSDTNIAGLASALVLGNSLRTNYNAHVADGGTGLATVIALANAAKTNYNAHILNGPAPAGLETAILLANDIRTKINLHLPRAGTVYDVSVTLANSLRTVYNNHLADHGDTMADALVLGNSLKVNYNAHIADGGTNLADTIVWANAFKTFYNAHVDDGGTALADSCAWANVLKTVINEHYADGGTALADACVWANTLKALYNAHCVDAAEHTTSPDAVNTIGAADATDTASLITLVSEMLTDYDAHESDAEIVIPGPWTYHASQEAGDHTLASVVAPTSLVECLTRLIDFQTKYNGHDDDDSAHGTHGSHQDTTPIVGIGTEAHPHAVDAVHPIVAANANDTATLITLVTEILTSYDGHDDDAELAAAWQYHDAQEGGDHSLASVVAPVSLAECITRLTDIKTKYNAHDADAACHGAAGTGVHQNATAAVVMGTEAHPHAADATHRLTSTNATDLASLIVLVSEALLDYDSHESDAELAAAWEFHDAQEGADHTLASTVAPTTLTLCITRMTDLQTCYNAHDADAACHGAAGTGIHQDTTVPVVFGAQAHPSKVDTSSVGSPNATTLATLITLINELLLEYTNHNTDAELVSNWQYHDWTNTATHVLASVVAPTSLAECVTRLNDIKTKLNAHDADAQSHTAISTHQEANICAIGVESHPFSEDTTNTIVAPVATDIPSLYFLVGELLTDYAAHNADQELTANWVYHQAKGTVHTLASAAAPTTMIEVVTRLTDLLAKYNAHDADAVSHGTGGTYPEVNPAPVYIATDVHPYDEDTADVIASPVATDLATLITLLTEELTNYAAHNTDAALAADWQYHKASFDSPLASAVAPTNLDECITRSNDIKAKYNIHIQSLVAHGAWFNADLVNAADAAYGTGLHPTNDDTTNLVTAGDATNLATARTLIADLLTQYDAHESDAELAAAWLYHGNQETGDHTLASVAAPTSLNECITRINDFKAKFNGHDADGGTPNPLCHYFPATQLYLITTTNATVGAGEHPSQADTINAISSPVATNLATLITLVIEFLTDYPAHNNDAKLAAAWLYHEAQQAGNDLAGLAAPTNLTECIVRLNDIQTKLNNHDSSNVSHTTGGLHQDASPAAAMGTAILVPCTGAEVGDKVCWAIIGDTGAGTPTVGGISAVPGVDNITVTFSADPGDTTIISSSVFKNKV